MVGVRRGGVKGEGARWEGARWCVRCGVCCVAAACAGHGSSLDLPTKFEITRLWHMRASCSLELLGTVLFRLEG